MEYYSVNCTFKTMQFDGNIEKLEVFIRQCIGNHGRIDMTACINPTVAIYKDKNSRCYHIYQNDHLCYVGQGKFVVFSEDIFNIIFTQANGR